MNIQRVLQHGYFHSIQRSAGEQWIIIMQSGDQRPVTFAGLYHEVLRAAVHWIENL